MRDTDAMKMTLGQLKAQTDKTAAASVQASDPDGLVSIEHGATTQVNVSRTLCPDPTYRDRLERAVSQAVDNLIASREREQRLLLETLGGQLSSQIMEEMRAPQDQFDQQMSDAKARMQAIRDRAAQRRR